MNLPSSRLSALRHITQVEATLLADRAADQVEAAIHHVWRRLLVAIRRGGNAFEIHRHAAHILHELLPTARERLHGSFKRLARWGYSQASANMRRVLPARWMHAAMIGRKHGLPARSTRESMEPGRVEIAIRDLLEDDRRQTIPGVIGFNLGFGGLSATDNLGRLREPARSDLGEEDQRDLFASLLFPPPSEGDVLSWLNTTLNGNPWYVALDQSARAAQFGPDQLAATIASGYARGEGQREIAKSVLPFVDGVRYRARRVARTFGMAIAQHAQEQADKQVDDLTVGWQVRATLDEWTRKNPTDPLKDHRRRSGTIFYKHPKPGQLGLDSMPHPPREYDGTIAFNCRCINIPVLSEPEWAKDDERLAVFRNAEEKLVPDPSTYEQWWNQVDEKRKRRAVGTRLYSSAQEILGRQPSWPELVIPQSGSLVSVNFLRNESIIERTDRVAQVKTEIARRKQDISSISTYGFLPQKVQ